MCGTGLRDLKRLNGGREVGDSPSQILVSATIDFDATCSWTARMFVWNLWGRWAQRKCKMLKHIDLRLLRHSPSVPQQAQPDDRMNRVDHRHPDS